MIKRVKQPANESESSGAISDTGKESIVDSSNGKPALNRGSWKSKWGSVERKLADTPKKYQQVYLRAISGKSRKAAVRSFCIECVGWQISEVRKCTCTACQLYPYRPGASSADSRNLSVVPEKKEA